MFDFLLNLIFPYSRIMVNIYLYIQYLHLSKRLILAFKKVNLNMHITINYDQVKHIMSKDIYFFIL